MIAGTFLVPSIKRFRGILGNVKYRVISEARCRWLSIKSFALGLFCTRRRIVLSRKKDWELAIRQGIDCRKYDISFRDFDRCELFSGVTLIPLTLHDAALLNASSESNRMQITCYVPSNAVIDLFDDKLAFSQWMTENGYESLTPRTLPLSQTLPLPYIIKKKRDAFGKNSFVVCTDTQRQTLGTFDEEEYFYQEYVNGRHEYTTHLLMKNKRIVFSMTIEFTFDVDHFVKGVQNKHASTRVVDCSFVPLFEEILARSDFSGICCFNFKLREGRPLIFEINPRFGASLCPYVNDLLVHYA